MRPYLLAALLVTTALSPAVAEERHPPKGKEGREAHEERCGTTKGQVTEVNAKGVLTIRTPQGPRTFAPPWRGGMPANGGGPDAEIVKQVQELAVGTYVEVGWEMDERLRVVRVRVIAHEPGAKREEPKARPEEPKAKPEERQDEAPQPQAGTVRGTVATVDAKGRFVLRTADGTEEAFMPHWRGGMPADGGGLDDEMVRRIAALKPGQQVEVGWEWDERKRCVTITEAK